MSLHGARATSVWIDDFGFEPAAKRIATLTRESKIFGETLHYANPIMYSFAELEEMATWCYKTFGAAGYNPCNMQTVWDYQYDPDYIFWFGEEKHLMMFILRWS
jgi:hypothetical protein